MMKADADYHFTIVGRNPEQGFLEELRGHEQVTVIPNAENLSEQYYRHSLCIVPILSGSGSRLKIPEGLVHGCPVISTSIGAEGYHKSEIMGLEIADTSESFANAVKSIVYNKNPQRQSIRAYASEHFTWTNLIRPEQIELA